jgi:hypothetical protein
MRNAAGLAEVAVMKVPWTSAAMFLIASFLGAAGQFLYKAGTDRAISAGGHMLDYLANGWIALGVVCYTLVMVCFVAGFRAGGSPSVLYPIYASTFVWAALFDWGANGVRIAPLHVVGMSLIIAGVAMMAR